MLSLKQSTKAKVINVTPMAMKLGQKETLPALALRLEFLLSNNELAQLAPGLREFLFAKGANPESNRAKQQGIEGVDPISDLPSLSIAGQRLGTFEWSEEQTGCTLTIDRGRGTKDSNITLEGCTYKKLQITAQEGGTFKARMTVNTSASEEIDDQTHGRVCKMKKREIYVMLLGPKLDETQQLVDGQKLLPEGASASPLTPIGALKDAVEGEGKDASWPFPTSGSTSTTTVDKKATSRRAAGARATQ